MRTRDLARYALLLMLPALGGCPSILTTRSSGIEINVIPGYVGKLCSEPDFWPVKGMVSKEDTPDTILKAKASSERRKAFCAGE